MSRAINIQSRDCCRGKSLLKIILLGLCALYLDGQMKAHAVQPPSDKGDHVATGGDLDFMNNAGPGGMAEVKLGELAVKRATSSEVKEFGQRMITDHSQAGKKLQQLARQKGVSLPNEFTPKQNETMKKLSKLSGDSFDRAYVRAMVEVHTEDVAAFKNVAQNGTDADVKAFAAKTVPTLEMHLQMIRAIAEKMDVKVK